LLRQFSAQAADADFEPGVDDAPVLRIVRHRAEERARLLSEVRALRALYTRRPAEERAK
jgi:hypothetical protein